MKLYEIQPAIAEIANNDELSQEQKQEQIQALELHLAEKIDNICAYVHEQDVHLDSLEKVLKEKLEAIKQQRKTPESLKAYALQLMQQNNLTEIKSKFFSKLKIVNNGGSIPVIIDDDVDIETIPQEFIKIKKEIDKTKIKENLEAGEVLEFARIGERGQRLSYK